VEQGPCVLERGIFHFRILHSKTKNVRPEPDIVFDEIERYEKCRPDSVFPQDRIRNLVEIPISVIDGKDGGWSGYLRFFPNTPDIFSQRDDTKIPLDMPDLPIEGGGVDYGRFGVDILAESMINEDPWLFPRGDRSQSPHHGKPGKDAFRISF
jgi:hypothetical protein